MGAADTRPRLIYVHGANGSGKTTLAHVLMTCAGRRAQPTSPPTAKVAAVTRTRGRLRLVGPYRSATGGADSVQPYALVPKTIIELLSSGRYDVFVEGLMTPGVDTCRRIYRGAEYLRAECTFIWLDVDIPTCTAHVQRRRDRKGNDKPYDNAHLVKKHRSSFSWAQNLLSAGIPIKALTWKESCDYCIEQFRLKVPSSTQLLDTRAGIDP